MHAISKICLEGAKHLAGHGGISLIMDSLMPVYVLSMQVPAVGWIVSTAYLKSFQGTYLDWTSLSDQVFIQLLSSGSALVRKYQIWIFRQPMCANRGS